MMLRFSNTKSSMLFNLMPVGKAPELVLDVYEKKTIQFMQCQLVQCSFSLVRAIPPGIKNKF